MPRDGAQDDEPEKDRRGVDAGGLLAVAAGPRERAAAGPSRVFRLALHPGYGPVSQVKIDVGEPVLQTVAVVDAHPARVRRPVGHRATLEEGDMDRVAHRERATALVGEVSERERHRNVGNQRVPGRGHRGTERVTSASNASAGGEAVPAVPTRSGGRVGVPDLCPGATPQSHPEPPCLSSSP